VWSAFAAIYLIWGTTYFAIAMVLRSIPPFVGAALRFGVAAAVLWTWLRLRSPRPLQGLPLKRLILTGALLLAGGNGLTTWAQQGVPSGVTALVLASAPLTVMMLDWAFFSGHIPAGRSLAGAMLGLLGVTLIIAHLYGLAGVTRPSHVLALLGSLLAWSTGTLLVRGAVAPERTIAASCVQMMVGCMVLGFMASVSGEWLQFDPARVTATSWLALLYLAVFGSIVALSCYLWLLTQVSAQKATTYALVNPVVALLLGATVLDERVTALMLLAVALILVGVALVLIRRPLPS